MKFVPKLFLQLFYLRKFLWYCFNILIWQRNIVHKLLSKSLIMPHSVYYYMPENERWSVIRWSSTLALLENSHAAVQSNGQINGQEKGRGKEVITTLRRLSISLFHLPVPRYTWRRRSGRNVPNPWNSVTKSQMKI